MSDLRWCKLVADAVAGRVTGEAERLDAYARLPKTSDYETARGQFLTGATDRVVLGLLDRAVMNLTS